MGASSAQVVDRLGSADRAVLASDQGAAPLQIAVLLEFDGADRPTSEELRALLAARLHRVPRLRQRLVVPEHRLAAPRWIAARDVDLGWHLRCIEGLAFDSRPTLHEYVADLLCEPLDHHRPLWRATLLCDEDRRVHALVVVLHHVLADGMAGLAALAALTDSGTDALEPTQPTAPHFRFWHRMDGLAELSAGSWPRPTPRISLTAPTGSRRRISVIRRPLAEVTELAHQFHAKVNDVLLTAVTGALLRVLRRRGECPGRLVVSVPIASAPDVDSGSGNKAAEDSGYPAGNHVGARLITVPAIVNDAARLRFIARETRQQRATLRRASSAVPLGIAFRVIAGLGLFSWFIEHQRLVHTFVSNLRGPSGRLSFGGCEVSHLTPMSVTPGNIGITFTALSYAGELTLTIVTDPGVCDPDEVADAASDTLAELAAALR